MWPAFAKLQCRARVVGQVAEGFVLLSITHPGRARSPLRTSGVERCSVRRGSPGVIRGEAPGASAVPRRDRRGGIFGVMIKMHRSTL